MSINQFVPSSDPRVDEALNLIEEDLKEAIGTAIGRINAVLEGAPSDTKVLHSHAAFLHDILAGIDRNREVRQRDRY